jgi:hypothetical protein
MATFDRTGVTDRGEIDKISHENALRWYGYDPFSVIPKDQATVGALRALATDVHTGTRTRAEFRELYAARG